MIPTAWLDRRRGRITVAAILVLAIASPALGQMTGPGGMGGGRNPARPKEKGSTAVVSESAKRMRDPEAGIRLEAVKELSGSDDKAAVPLLIEATADVDPRVKLKAIDALGTMRASDATPVLVQMLYLRDSPTWLKQRVLVALGKIGDQRSARPVADFIARDTDRATIGTAIFALGEIGDPATIPDLQKLNSSSTDERLRQLSEDSIGKIRQRAINPEIEVKALRPRDGEEPRRPAGASAGAPVAY